MLRLFSVNGSGLKGLRAAWVSTEPDKTTTLIKREREDVQTLPADQLVINPTCLS